jgi:hypothetical protein
MHDNVGSEVERILKTWWTKGRVYEEEGATRVGLASKGCNVVGLASRVERGLEVNDIAFAEILGGTIQWKGLESRQTGVDGEDAVRTMVPLADGHAAGLEVGLCAMASVSEGVVARRMAMKIHT